MFKKDQSNIAYFTAIAVVTQIAWYLMVLHWRGSPRSKHGSSRYGVVGVTGSGWTYDWGTPMLYCKHHGWQSTTAPCGQGMSALAGDFMHFLVFFVLRFLSIFPFVDGLFVSSPIGSSIIARDRLITNWFPHVDVFSLQFDFRPLYWHHTPFHDAWLFNIWRTRFLVSHTFLSKILYCNSTW